MHASNTTTKWTYEMDEWTCMECVARMDIDADDIEYISNMDAGQTLIVDAGMVMDTRESNDDTRPNDMSHIHGYCNNCYVGNA